MRIPWPLGAIDPHRLDDVAAAVFGDALFDTLYARDETGAIVPSLAESDPDADAGGVRVTLRRGLLSAHGRPIDARDVVLSLARARALAARAWLADIPPPRIDKDRLTIRFAMRDPTRLARALSSPLTAIVPTSFAPERPDGSGPFRAEARGETLVFTRNPVAARGAAALDEMVVRPAADLSDSLRWFESGADDIGWLGSGLHQPRRGSQPFDAGSVGWAVLRTGRDAGAAWDAPGVAQSLCDAVPQSALASLEMGPSSPNVPTTGPRGGWGGAPCELLVRDDAKWLIELARVIAATLSSPTHDVTPKPVPSAEFAQRRAMRGFTLALDVVRRFGPGPVADLAALSTADDPATAVDVVRHAPKGGALTLRAFTQLMRLGIVGEIRVQGGRVADLVLPLSSAAPGIDWGAAIRPRRA